ncbi:MAG: type II toxin-antitoxin system VapC family toxin [Dermatophilaceae bacterium]
MAEDVVLDASACVELLLRTSRGAVVADLLSAGPSQLHVPGHFVTECLHALRALRRRADLVDREAELVVDDLLALPVRTWGSAMLTPRVWELKDALSAYDATYVALAEAVDLPLVTCDVKLAAGASGPSSAEVRLVG